VGRFRDGQEGAAPLRAVIHAPRPEEGLPLSTPQPRALCSPKTCHLAAGQSRVHRFGARRQPRPCAQESAQAGQS